MMQSRSLLISVVLLLSLLWSTAGISRASLPVSGRRDLAVLAFVDLNGDGAYGLTGGGEMEPGLPDIEIGLYNDLPPIGFHGPEDTLITSARTNQDGYVVFRGLPTGLYFLVSALANGYLPTTPLEQPVTVDGNGQGTVLEFMFGQLARTAFRYRIIFAVIGGR
jgi:hypothetical protein